jgi:hypothetical protein
MSDALLVGEALRAEVMRAEIRRVVDSAPPMRAPLKLRARVELATLGRLTMRTRARLWVARRVGAL